MKTPQEYKEEHGSLGELRHMQDILTAQQDISTRIGDILDITLQIEDEHVRETLNKFILEVHGLMADAVVHLDRYASLEDQKLAKSPNQLLAFIINQDE